ncbi:uncharacterized protein C11orf52 homolog [Hemicordylus capensis]|uniref:uncharacterized protein C11orf52 homolog n=1 Tax=Hemicordylus capensis TaxID=884348 RepID=UPI0023047881|nr:uncharacterized protein C11orf52 homolog [Hemicordylus capensis]
MGNHHGGCCSGGGGGGGCWNCLSPAKRKKEKPGSRTSKPTAQHPESKKGFDVTPVYDDVSDFPVYATVSKPKHLKCDDSNVHYADIQVFTKVRERSTEEVKSLQTHNATEYATLNFPRATLKYDNKNGTLV